MFSKLYRIFCVSSTYHLGDFLLGTFSIRIEEQTNPSEEKDIWKYGGFQQGGLQKTSYLEDHPRTRKWLVTMVSKSPKWGCSPYKWPFHGL